MADQQWQKEYDFAMQQYLDSQKASSGSDSSKPGVYDGGNEYTANPGWDTETIKAFQQAHGLTVDGIWGPKTAAAYDSDPDWTGGPEPELSQAGKTFLSKLPYVPASGDPEAWKRLADDRLRAAFERGELSETDVMLIIKQLNLE